MISKRTVTYMFYISVNLVQVQYEIVLSCSLLTERYRVRSSAYSKALEFTMTLQISFIYNTNNNPLSTEP